MLLRLSWLWPLFCAGLVFFAGVAQAQKKPAGGQAPVIAILDTQKVIQQSDASAAARKSLAEYRDVLQRKFAARGEALRKRQDELARQQAVLSNEAFERRRLALDRDLAGFRRNRDRINANLNQANAIISAKIRRVMAKELAAVMKEWKIDLTLARSAVLVFDEQLNVTAEVLARVNKALPEVPLEFEDEDIMLPAGKAQ